MRGCSTHTHTRSSCKFLLCAFKRFSCVPCRHAKNMLRAFFCAARGCPDYHSVLVGRFEFFFHVSKGSPVHAFRIWSLLNVPRRQTPHSSPHLQFAQMFNPSHMVAPFLSVWPSTLHLLLKLCSCVRRREASEFLHHLKMQSLSVPWLFLLKTISGILSSFYLGHF